MNKSAKDFLGDANYPAISYGGYRLESRELQPTIEEIKEDLLIMFAQGFRAVSYTHLTLPTKRIV